MCLATLRAKTLIVHQQVPWPALERLVHENLTTFLADMSPSLVLSYVPFQTAAKTFQYQELNLTPLLAQLPQYDWALPRVVDDRHMQFHRYRAGEALQTGRYGLQEPVSVALDEALLNQPGVYALVPGILFAKNGQRLGRGKGYYDRFLAAHPTIVPVGVAPQVLVCPVAWDANAWDVSMQVLVTEAGVFGL